VTLADWWPLWLALVLGGFAVPEALHEVDVVEVCGVGHGGSL
jgi:hypothetical protein